MGKNDIDAMIDIIPVDPLSDRVQGSSRGRKRTRLMILEYRKHEEGFKDLRERPPICSGGLDKALNLESSQKTTELVISVKPAELNV